MLDGKRISIDDKYPYRSFPEGFLHYLEALGIEKGNEVGQFLHNGKELEVKMYDRSMIIWSKDGKEIARFDIDYDSLFFINNGKDAAFTISTGNSQVFESNSKTKNTSIVYSCGERYYSLSVFSDIIGEINLSFSYCGEYSTVEIVIGEEHKSASYYMQQLWSLINTSTIKPYDLKYIQCMFKDLAFQETLQNKINCMAPDIETAVEMKTNAIKAYHQDEITKAMNEILKNQEYELEKLDQYKNYCLNRQGENVQKGK